MSISSIMNENDFVFDWRLTMLKYNNNKGEFTVTHAQEISYTYFPLCNAYGMKSSITPTLHGDMKLNQHQFLMPPVSQDDLHQTGQGRNFWIKVKDSMPFSVSGNSAGQKVTRDDLTVEAGFLWHKVTLTHQNLRCESTTVVPVVNEAIEITRISVHNNASEPIQFTPWSVTPLYGRSADNLRDHRHVTALLNQFKIVENGIINHPTLTFDERGHHMNTVEYGVFVNSSMGQSRIQYFPVLEEFIGEGGSLDWPLAIINNEEGIYKVNDIVSGYEGIGGFRFEDVQLEPGKTVNFYVGLMINDRSAESKQNVFAYLNDIEFTSVLSKTELYWEKELSTLQFRSGRTEFDHWMKWVALQPILRRIYGCSFLPHHDYGRGGRGWRDLWQDCLALIVMNPEPVREMLFNNYAGVRLDGTNATIIGERLGEFKADRNNIPRVWMDHGLWPLITTQLYIDRTGDVDFLFEKQSYFRDENAHYGKKKVVFAKEDTDEFKENKALTSSGELYFGTILEHILVQNLIAVHNIGEHGVLRLEGADWNDGLDMAKNRGESVAFTAAYVGNLDILLQILDELKSRNISELILQDALVNLILNKSEYDPQALNKEYFKQVELGSVSGQTPLNIDQITLVVQKKKQELTALILQQEWHEIDPSSGFFNGYYDNSGRALEYVSDYFKESEDNKNVNMTLTGQVFTVMSKIASREQTQKIINAADRYLFDERVGGYKLNTNYQEVKLDMGRLFGFAYGHKENGAMFSHMAIMYSNALYQQGFCDAGFKVIRTLYEHVHRFETSKIYPGIPEYIEPKGRGMYHYLTGSASWLILTMINEVYGIKGHFGDLILKPAIPEYLLKENKTVEIQTLFLNKSINVHYQFTSGTEGSIPTIDQCRIDDTIYIENGRSIQDGIEIQDDGRSIRIKQQLIDSLENGSGVVRMNVVFA